MADRSYALVAICLFAISAPVARAQEEAIAEAVAEARPEESRKVRPLTVAAGLIDDTVITGTLLDSTSLSIRTAFGEAAIPLAEVAGIRFPVGEDTSTTVVMLNGDSITGATDLKFASVETSWGSAKINGQSIANLLFVPGLEWEASEAMGGKRWILAEKKPEQPASTVSAVQPASGNQPIPQLGELPQGSRYPTPAPQIIYGR